MEDNQQVPPIIENQQPQVPSQGPNEEVVNKENPLPKKRKLLFLAIIILFLLITVAITAFAYFKYQEKGESIKINISTTTTTTNLTNSPTPADGLLPTPEVVEGELIVKYKQGMGPDEVSINRKTEIDKILADLGMISEEKMYESSSSALKNYYIINFEKDVNLDSMIDEIKKLPEIENVEKNYINQVD